MAASLSRPDPTSPASVAEAGFSTSRKGYQPDEVRAFLQSVASEMGRLKERERQLEAELRAARASVTGKTELDDETVTRMLGEETLRVLQTARESASQIKVRAEENAARIMREAHDEANRIRQEADVEAARQRHDAQSDAEAEVALAKQQGREMVTEARAYRERVLADLERRTKVARQHIEELANGRDRLLQVFERARLVAVDITTELQRVDGPDEFVSFAPTTGPVPLMVPASKLDDPRRGEVGEEGHEQGNDDTTLAIDVAIDVATDVATDAGDDAEISAADHDVQTADGVHVDETIVEPSADATETVAEPETGAQETADDPAVETGTDDANDAPSVDGPQPEAAAPKRDTNVVALFPGRAEEQAAQQEPAHQDVGDIFARLRSESQAEAEAEATAEAAEAAAATATAAEAAASDDTADAGAASTVFTRRDETIVPLITTAARKLKRVLADEQNGVLDTLRRKEPVTSLETLVADVEAHTATYLASIADELGAAAAAGAAEFGAKDTKTLRRTLDRAGALDATRALVRTDLVGPLRNRLERAVSDGSGDNDDTTRRVRAVYREWKTQHIDDQLDDVFRFAFGGGMAVTAEPGQPMLWTIDPSQAACADCEDNSLAGPVAAGESFPTGHASAPAHPGCRCVTLPVHQ